ncbi:MAG: hypothetical protein ACOC6O_00785 [Chloroflexota bacterium]
MAISLTRYRVKMMKLYPPTGAHAETPKWRYVQGNIPEFLLLPSPSLYRKAEW